MPMRRDRIFLHGMASHGAEDVAPPELEKARPSTVDLAESLSSLLADAPAGGDGCGSLEEAGPGDGESRSVAEVLASEMLGREELQPGESQRLIQLRGGDGLELSFLEDGQTLMAVQTLKKRPKRVVESALLLERRGAERNPEEEEDRGTYWAEGRASKAERRVARAVRAVQRRHQRGHDREQENYHQPEWKWHRPKPWQQEAKASSQGIGSARIARHSREFGASSSRSPDGPSRGTADDGHESLMAQRAEPGAELDLWGNPILQVEVPRR